MLAKELRTHLADLAMILRHVGEQLVEQRQGDLDLAEQLDQRRRLVMEIAETPMVIFAGNEREPMGSGFFGSDRVAQAFSLNGGSSSCTSLKRPINGVGDQ